IIIYLKEIYIVVKEEWVTYYINEHLNFGYRTISPIKLVNCTLKSYIISGKS
ncbi:hypothetical protein QBC45DRAFT_300937, partial [Copromyces sp. CBS 386.78]